MKKLRQWTYGIIREDDVNRLSGTIFDTVIIVFIVVNAAFVVLDTFHIGGWYSTLSSITEGIAVAVFTVEYAVRVWTAPLMYPEKKPLRACLKYIFSFMALIDLLSILPFYLSFILPAGFGALRTLRIIRLLRVFKISRYTDAFTIIGNVFRKKAHQLLSSLLIIFMLMLIASVMMYDIESAAQPEKFTNAFTSFWWVMSTVTTIGYGDLVPITTAGQVLGIFIALMGIGMVAIPTGIISAGFIQESQRVEREEREAHLKAKGHAVPAHGACEVPHSPDEAAPEKQYCPYCGEKLE